MREDRRTATILDVNEDAEAHQRAVAHARRKAPGLFDNAYVLYREDASGHHHGIATCGSAPRHPVELGVKELLDLADAPDECECGGWRSTTFFPALLTAHRSMELHLIETRGGIADVAQALEQLDRMQPWWRPDLENDDPALENVAALARENYRIELEMLDRCADTIDTRPLVRYIAAHGLATENDIHGARQFVAWAETLNPRTERAVTISDFWQTLPALRGAGRQDHHRRRFDAELDRALAGERVVAVVERRLWSPADGATWHMPAEVLLLSLTCGQSAATDFAWLELPEVVAAGIRTLLAALAGPERLGIIRREALPEPAVRDVAETLWRENDGTWKNPDDILAAAERLADERR